MATEPDAIRVVIVGAGFAGAYAFKYLHAFYHRSPRVKLTLVNEHNYFLFTPLLHEVATGLQSPINVTEPLRKVLCCLDRLYVTRAERVDTKRQMVKTQLGDIAYDYLVLATGSTTNFYNVPGADKYSFTLKSLADARALKNHIIRNFEIAACKSRDEELLNFVIVGGGPTGVEMAAEIWDLVDETFTNYYHDANHARVILIQALPTLMPQMPAGMGGRALKILRKKGVEVILEKTVTAVEPNGVKIATGEFIKTNTVIWAAGIKPNEIEFDVKPELEKDGRLKVNDYLQLAGAENIFALGDGTAMPGWQGNLAPAKAQAAFKAAAAAARNIVRMIQGKPLKKFAYRPTGELVSLGRWRALGNIAGINFSGRVAWWLWRAVYLTKLLSWQKKLRVSVDWFLDLFSPRDISEI